ncbi:MAG: AIR synthase family protein [Bacillota bacterium]|nr:AIR synthase family protein [Bacillota bacterium]
MKVGKVPNELLEKIILGKIKKCRGEVVLRPKIGEDCSAVDFGEQLCVVTTDPITGATNKVGSLAVHISCNDLASSGAEPVGLMITILAPPETAEKELEEIMSQITETAASVNAEILGGHTEITSAVNRLIINCTALGKACTDKMVTTSGAKPDNFIIMTKSAGLEGTSIIANDNEKHLVKNLGHEIIKNAKSFIDRISVVREGLAASKFGATAMHDATEGGILGAVWELAEASGVGVVIHKDKIPVENETKKICEVYNIDPLKLISSGSMIIAAQDGEGMIKKLENEGIQATIIGMTTLDCGKYIIYNNNKDKIEPPEADELYKAVK